MLLPLQSDKAKLVDVWIEVALLISKPPLDRRHFDRETRQNLKKMRPCAAQLVGGRAGLEGGGGQGGGKVFSATSPPPPPPLAQLLSGWMGG